jgi:L-idonate 5-dehydrogenase
MKEAIHMKAVVIHKAKDLRIEERPIPEPGPGAVRLRLAYAGICGSDLHYYHLGRVGNAIVRDPMVLGHELSGVIDKLGPGVAENHPVLCAGQHVTVNPSHECCECPYCLSGRQNLCGSLRYFGSAARTPHVQGIMQDFPIVQARHCIPVATELPLAEAACIEPLAIALHAVSRISTPSGPDLLGKRIFISGAGPVGALIAAVSRLGGAREIYISDLYEFPLTAAKQLGADCLINAKDNATLAGMENGFDYCFEASGSVSGMQSALRSVIPGGQIVHVGFLPEEEVPYPVNTMLIRKEVTAHGALRAYQEFIPAARLLEGGRLDVSPMISGIYPLEKAEEAIISAMDKTKSIKVLLGGPAATEHGLRPRDKEGP